MELITLKEGTDNVVEMFWIGTKPTIKQIDGSQFQIPDKNALLRAARKANLKGKGFIIQPDKLAKRVDAHFYSNPRTYQSLVDGYLDPTRCHGTFTGETNGPYSYNDGTDDVYLTASVQLHHDKAASVLLEHGSNAAIPFAISPHIWPTKGEGMNIEDFDFVGSALVDKGAYGHSAVISKLCKGPVNECIATFKPKDKAANDSVNCTCSNCQGVMLNEIINSRISLSASNNLEMSDPKTGIDQTSLPGANAQQMNLAEAGKLSPEPSGQTFKLSKEEYERFTQYKQDSEDKAQLEQKVKALELESKINALKRMFPADVITDPNARQVLLDKYAKLENKDVNGLETFLIDINETMKPLWLAQAKAQWEAELKTAQETNTNTNTTDTQKGKKKDVAASLRPEPEKQDEQPKDQAASNINKISKIAEFRNLLGSGK